MSREYILQPFNPPIELQIDYARELNPQQFAAVTAPPGPSLVIAGAGSGKTRTLTYRVAYLLEQGISPERILLLTFTNKAAREMMRRVADLLGRDLPSLWGGTFHALGNRILRQHADLLGYQRDFAILDREDSKDLLTACIGEGEHKPEAGRFPKPDVLVEIFSLASNMRKSIGQILSEQFEHFEHLHDEIAELEKRYTARKLSTGGMDFDDLIMLWLKLLQDHSSVREHYQRRFQFILVDEYQDTNGLQSELIDTLAARHHNLMVVGDDAQSIYAWRGANFQNIIRFPERYPEAKIYRIETNYRSTPEILQVANSAIAANVSQFAKQLSAVRKSGTKPVLAVCHDGSEQAAFVAQRVLELREEGCSLDRMAVLYRSHFHALELQLELTRRNIPFSITSGIRFFEQAHIKDVAAYLKLTANPRDELAFKRLAQLLPGIGAKAAAKLWKQFSSRIEQTGQPASIEAAPTTQVPGKDGGSQTVPVPPGNIAVSLQACATVVPKKSAVAWAQFTATMAQLDMAGVRGNPSKMVRLVLDAGYEDYLEETYTNYRTRLEDLEQLGAFAQQFPNVEDFLTQLALLSDVEGEEEAPKGNDDEQLKLSTVHQAKGLEFDVVFVIMLCDGLFPSGRSLDFPETLEEERRLLYVAMTRARNELYLSYPLIRVGYGGGGDSMQRPSRFLQEIPNNQIEEWSLKPFHPY